MKTNIKIFTIVSLLLTITMAGFSQGTVGMKFRVHQPPSPLDPPYSAIYVIRDITTSTDVEVSSSQAALPTTENDYTFTTPTLVSTDTYRFDVYVQDSNGHYNAGGTVSFTGAQYNFGGPNFKENTNIINL